VPSKDEVDNNRLTLTMEDLQRENEISLAVEAKPRTITQALAQLQASPTTDVNLSGA
jgi:hypothetical protein